MLDPAHLVFIAAKKHVTAIDGRTGARVWTTEVPGSKWVNAGFMTLTVDPTGVYACRNGVVTCLDPIEGTILWSIKPPHAGSALPVVATMLGGGGGHAPAVAAAHAQQQAAAAAAG